MNQKHAEASLGTLQGSGLGNSTGVSKQPGSGRTTEKTSGEEFPASSAGLLKDTGEQAFFLEAVGTHTLWLHAQHHTGGPPLRADPVPVLGMTLRWGKKRLPRLW